MRWLRSTAILLISMLCHGASAQESGDRLIDKYFALETTKLSNRSFADIHTLDDWKKQREQRRQQLLEMLGLNPLPAKTKLHAKTIGSITHDEFVVERVQFQSRPGLYVTGNLYRPLKQTGPLPAVLYVCGHGGVKKNGISFGNKVHYQHHGSWFARHGYVCLTLDSLQLGEIEGIHHGTYRHDMWWWNNRGYSPAGVEAWNCVRALDYLQIRKEVDPERLAVTGRSGGGAYSWFIAAIDARIKVAVPVAGITDLQNHVVDGCVEGHCDCMYIVNTYRWDYAELAALVAPRPLLISNSDRDGIFPLDGVTRLHKQVAKIYTLYDAEENLGLNITPGGHKDTQELRVNAFRWLDTHLRKSPRPIRKTADSYFTPEQLRVFVDLPKDQKNSDIHETFVSVATPKLPVDAADWQQMSSNWKQNLTEKVFRGWPQKPTDLKVEEAFSVVKQGVRFRAFDFTSQQPFRLRLYIAHREGLKTPKLNVLNVLDHQQWNDMLGTYGSIFAQQLGDDMKAAKVKPDPESFAQTKKMFNTFDWAMSYVAPRGVGPTRWYVDISRKQIQIRRRFMLLGQTLDGMRVWDTRRTIQALRSQESLGNVPLWLQATGSMGGVTLYASLFEPDVVRLDLHDLPASHRQGPILLNVRRVLDIPQAVAMVSEKSRIALYHKDANAWNYPQEVGRRLKWDKKQLQVRAPLKD